MSTNLIQNYIFEKTSTVRVITDINNNPLFIGKDVAIALGYKNPPSAITKHCNDAISVKNLMLSKVCGAHTFIQIKDLHPQTQLIGEPDLYSLIFGSELESAQRFKKWIYTEVIPSIRKTGTYSIVQNSNTQQISTIQHLTSLITNLQNQIVSMNSAIISLENKLTTTKFGIRGTKQFHNSLDLDEVVFTILPLFGKESIPNYVLKEQLYEHLREYKLVATGTTMPTTYGIKSGVVGIEAVPICYADNGAVGKSVKTVIYEKYFQEFVSSFMEKIKQRKDLKLLSSIEEVPNLV